MSKFTAYRLFLKWDELQCRKARVSYDLAYICMIQKMRIVSMYELA